ncbi:hypothetical protein GF407_12125 [candidate division KSB1 bacterium]|nr:hypothetical protein [candidate division KSB1 bacterium]
MSSRPADRKDIQEIELILKKYLFPCVGIFFLFSSAFAYSAFKFGVQTHFGQFYRADMDSADMIFMLDSLQSAGIHLIRDECYWADVERDAGHYHFPQEVDFYVQAVAERDIDIVMLFDYNNPVYAPGAGTRFIIQHPTSLQPFMFTDYKALMEFNRVSFCYSNRV